MREHGFYKFSGIAKRSVIIQVEFFQIAAQQQPLPDAIKHFEIWQSHFDTVFPENPLAKSMERGNINIHKPVGQKHINALFHFSGCLLTKRQSQNLFWFHALLDEISDPPRDHSSLASTRASDNQKRS